MNPRRLIPRLRWHVRHELDHRWAPSRMSDYLDGDLPDADRERMRRHVGECADCSRDLSGLRTVVHGLAELRGRASESSVVQGVLRRMRDDA